MAKFSVCSSSCYEFATKTGSQSKFGEVQSNVDRTPAPEFPSFDEMTKLTLYHLSLTIITRINKGAGLPQKAKTVDILHTNFTFEDSALPLACHVRDP